MKKLVFILFLLLGAGLIYENHISTSQENIEIYEGLPEKEEKKQALNITKNQIYQGNLLLVNKDYSVHSDAIQKDVINIYDTSAIEVGLLNIDIRLSKKIGEEFSQMISAAKRDGIQDFMISSGFRDLGEQAQIYEDKGADYALPPGNSEHNLGLSLDVGSLTSQMSEAPEGKWIEENAWKFGFVVRYPEDKTSVTGIQYEPWHIRYVGVPHSAVMNEKNFVLEEYLEYLKEQKSITATINGETYSISYFPVSEDTTIQVPVNKQYEISGNNFDGVILTVNEYSM